MTTHDRIFSTGAFATGKPAASLASWIRSIAGESQPGSDAGPANDRIWHWTLGRLRSNDRSNAGGNLKSFPVRSPTGSCRMLLLHRDSHIATSEHDPLLPDTFVHFYRGRQRAVTALRCDPFALASARLVGKA
jgi:hypothetical protein